GQVVGVSSTAAGGPLYTIAYERDDAGRITRVTETVEGITSDQRYHYDQGGRLTEVRQIVGAGQEELVEQYEYDLNGNRTQATVAGVSISGAYDDRDAISTYGDAAFSHTAAGERLTRAVGGLTTRYGYDVPGNLVGVALPDGRQVTYLVDGQNRRVGKRIGGTLVQGFLCQDQLRP